jgi:hypothetical protein
VNMGGVREYTGQIPYTEAGMAAGSRRLAYFHEIRLKHWSVSEFVGSTSPGRESVLDPTVGKEMVELQERQRFDSA